MENALIYERMAAIFAEAPVIGKDQTNRDQGFKFRGIDDVYNTLRSVMAKNNVFTTSEIIESRRYEGQTKNGTAFVDSELVIRWRFYTLDGSAVASESVGVGRDYADKYASKAMAIAHKYALVQVFCIPTHEPGNDPDEETIPGSATHRKPDSERQKQQDSHRTYKQPSEKQAQLIEKLIMDKCFTDDDRKYYRNVVVEGNRDWSAMIDFLKAEIEKRGVQ